VADTSVSDMENREDAMDGERARQVAELRELIDAGASGEGLTESPVAGLAYYRASSPEPREPMVLEPSLCVVASGEKKAYVGEETYTYDPMHYRVLTVPLPVEIEVTRASEEDPLLVVALELDRVELTDVLLDMDDLRSPGNGGPSRGISTSPVHRELLAAVVRLLRAAGNKDRRKVLAPLARREILFHLLAGEQGGLLREVALRDSRSERVARALRFIQEHYRESLDVETIAREVHMSPSTLHHNFKAVTSTSPIQYLKTVRLHRARMLMLQEGMTAAGAAREVGYESPSQFSREFRRHFGEPPARHVSSLEAGEASLV